MTDEQLQAQRDAETPEVRELRDKEAQLRSLLAALNDIPQSRWSARLKAAWSLCDTEDIEAAAAMEAEYQGRLQKRYRDA